MAPGNASAHGEVRDLRNGKYMVRLISEDPSSYNVHVKITLEASRGMDRAA